MAPPLPAGTPPPPSQIPCPSSKRGPKDNKYMPHAKQGESSLTSNPPATTLPHPLRHVSFPPGASQTAIPSSPDQPTSPSKRLKRGNDTQADKPPAKKRGRKSNARRALESAAKMAEGTPNTEDGPVRPGSLGTDSIEIRSEDEDSSDEDSSDSESDSDEDSDEGQDDDEDSDGNGTTRTSKESRQEEDLRALIKRRMGPDQFARYEVYNWSKLSAKALRKHMNKLFDRPVAAPPVQLMQVACKLFLGQLAEEAHRVQQEYVAAGVKQTDLADEEEYAEGLSEQSKARRQAPLAPDHFREAFKRLKFRVPGTSGLARWNSQVGIGRFPTKAGGRRLFR